MIFEIGVEGNQLAVGRPAKRISASASLVGMSIGCSKVWRNDVNLHVFSVGCPRNVQISGRVRWGQAVGPESDLLVFDKVVAEVDNHRMEAPLEPEEERMQVVLGRPC
jgi:hypothetical protein